MKPFNLYTTLPVTQRKPLRTWFFISITATLIILPTLTIITGKQLLLIYQLSTNPPTSTPIQIQPLQEQTCIKLTSLLMYLSSHIPRDVRLNTLIYNNNGDITLEGTSRSQQSLLLFIKHLNAYKKCGLKPIKIVQENKEFMFTITHHHACFYPKSP